MKKLFEFITGHGFGIMMTGFFIAIASLIVFMRVRYGSQDIRLRVMGSFVFGIALYLTGRIGVAVGRKKSKSQESDESSQDENQL